MRFSMLRQMVFTAVVGTVSVAFLAGCGGGDDSSSDAPDGQAALQGTGEATGEHRDEHEADEDAEAIAKNLAKLSDEDRALAEAQKLCPIGMGPLGAMGEPYKLVLNGKTVFLCCSHCKEKAEEDPKETLATVAQLLADNSGETTQ